MPFEVLQCPHCGAALPAEAAGRVVTCTFCGRALRDVGPTNARDFGEDPPGEPPGDSPADPDLTRVQVAGRRYVLLGLLGRGDGADVFLARRDGPLTERVVLKVARALADADLLAREWTLLQALHASTAQGAEHFTTLLPQLVARGVFTGADGLARAASVFRWRSGFQHTLDDVAREHPAGVDPRAAVWLWKRTLELLGWVHRSGYVHGAVLPPHLLVHPRDHGVVLAGWSCGVRVGGREALPATSAAHEAYYPRAVWAGAAPTPTTDIAMSARCMVRALGGDPATGALPGAVPNVLAALVRDAATLDGSEGDAVVDAWALVERVGQVGHGLFGPPRYHRLSMPGWR